MHNMHILCIIMHILNFLEFFWYPLDQHLPPPKRIRILTPKCFRFRSRFYNTTHHTPHTKHHTPHTTHHTPHTTHHTPHTTHHTPHTTHHTSHTTHHTPHTTHHTPHTTHHTPHTTHHTPHTTHHTPHTTHHTNRHYTSPKYILYYIARYNKELYPVPWYEIYHAPIYGNKTLEKIWLRNIHTCMSLLFRGNKDWAIF